MDLEEVSQGKLGFKGCVTFPAAPARFWGMLYSEYSRNPNNWTNTATGDSQLSVHAPGKFLVLLAVGKSRKLESERGEVVKKRGNLTGSSMPGTVGRAGIFGKLQEFE